MRRTADRIGIADIAQPQCNRIDAEIMRELVHRALDGKGTDRLAGRAHECVGQQIEIERVLHDIVALRFIERAA